MAGPEEAMNPEIDELIWRGARLLKQNTGIGTTSSNVNDMASPLGHGIDFLEQAHIILDVGDLVPSPWETINDGLPALRMTVASHMGAAVILTETLATNQKVTIHNRLTRGFTSPLERMFAIRRGIENLAIGTAERLAKTDRHVDYVKCFRETLQTHRRERILSLLHGHLPKSTNQLTKDTPNAAI